MNSSNNKSAKSVSTWLGLVVVAILLVGGVCWGMWPMNHVATGSSQREFTMDLDFDKFRQIMVRKNATESLVAHSGMKLLNEEVNELLIDIPKQKHPILNAVLGKSNADVSASKQITVSLDNPDIDAKEMILNQRAQMDSEQMDVTTQASKPAGNLTDYSTRLRATKIDAGTKVELTINQSINVKVPKVFVSEANRRVQQAAANSTAEQENAIRTFISKYQNGAIILPDLH